jgi:branched-chain amino acid transport system substrate-binding protein
VLSKQKLRIAALSTAVIAFADTSGSALAQKKYDTGATDTEIAFCCGGSGKMVF